MRSWLGILFVVMAFGPLAIMGALWVVALVLWLAGRPRFLTMLVERTGLGQRGDTTAEEGRGEGTRRRARLVEKLLCALRALCVAGLVLALAG